MKRKSICRLITLTTVASAVSMASAFAAAPITLEAFLREVQEQNPGVRGAEASARGYELLEGGSEILTTPFLFGNYTNLNDKQEQVNPTFSGSSTENNQYTVGVGMNTPVGLGAKISHNISHTKIAGASPAFLPTPDFYTAYNKLELNQSLIKNGFGSEIRARRDAMESERAAQMYGARFSSVSQLVQAENAYWRLAFARKAVVIQKDALARAERALEWAKKRVNLQLGDKSDLLQAQAAYDLRRMDLLTGEEEVRNAGRAFNTLRNIEGVEVASELALPSIDETLRLAPLAKEGVRLDIKAAEAQANAAVAKAQIDKESVKPTLDLFGNFAWSGRDGKKPDARSEAFGNNRPITSYGINFNVPLALGAVTNSIKGAELIKDNANYVLEQSRLNESYAWNEVSSRFNEARTRLGLIRTIENVQKDKYENERQRLLRGRTTTFQALAFEQDYATTQLNALRVQNEVLQLHAQMKLFRGEQ